ncbi:MAG TPA: glucose-6-phosphate isomerase [Caulobacteraceae bacterium]|jgi:glucose-6-phosphate isomerase
MSPDAAWTALKAAAEGGAPIAALFGREPNRLNRLTVEACGLTLDLSKQPWSLDALDAALALARASDVEGWRAKLFAGEAVNASEGRAVLHMALRAQAGDGYAAQGAPVMADVDAVRTRMQRFADEVQKGKLRTILHIGIGGSDLGPRLLWDALRPLKPSIDLRFVANVDGADFALATADLDPAQTLVVIVSKTFTTQETLANAQAARAWLVAGVGEANVGKHLAAVSTALDKTKAFGIDDQRVFGFWDWVGGRYSLWSAVSLSVACALGWDAFQRLLDGARAMDAHFRDAPLETNAPVLLALAQIFNRNGLGRASRTVVPYAHRLRRLPAFLQQLEMESNGKGVTRDGKPLAHATAPAVFGGEGTNVQHAYFQQIHQGPDVVPVEFVTLAESDEGPVGMHTKLLANVVAQAEALMTGRSDADVRAELQGKGLSSAEVDALAPQRSFPGDRPSTLILLDRLTPERLGALIALYEHKTFVEGVIWGINSFDQWGVELGKTLAGRVLAELEGAPAGVHDPSTTALIQRLKR